jgi:transposase
VLNNQQLIANNNYNDRYLKIKYNAYCKKKAYLDKIASKLKNNNIAVGYGNWVPAKGIKYGYRHPPVKYFINFLRNRGIQTCKIDEYNTSKLCYNCLDVLYNFLVETNEKNEKTLFAVDSKAFSKIKYCQNCSFILNRDTNASRNIVRLYYEFLANRERCDNFKRNFNKINTK